MVLNELVVKMTDIFENDYIKGDDFETFKEMVNCYCYDSNDIKDEVLANMKDYSDNFADNGDYSGEVFVPYKAFIKKVYSELKLRNIYD